MANYVTDRTFADLKRIQRLRLVNFENMTDSEKNEFMQPSKGAYGHEDLNRVEYAVEELSAQLLDVYQRIKDALSENGVADDAFFSVPYSPESLKFETKTDWHDDDIPTTEDMNRYLENVKKICSFLEYSRPTIPSSMERLGVDGANNIEKALQGLETAAAAFEEMRKNQIDRTAESWYYSDEIYGGEAT